MNIGKCRNRPKYICDKCGKELHFTHHRGYEHHKYLKQDRSYTPKRDFDLCDNCEKKFRQWLNTKELETTEEIINKFPKYEED